MIALGWLLFIALEGFLHAGWVFLLALMLNILLSKKRTLSSIVHLLAILSFGAFFFNKTEGELGRAMAFMVSYLIGALVSYILYLILFVKILNKDS